MAIIAAAVVKAPEGSAITEMANIGGSIAAFAASSISRAKSGSRPPISIAVARPWAGAREKMASCTSGRISSSVTWV